MAEDPPTHSPPSPDTVERLRQSLTSGNEEAVRAILTDRHPADQVKVLLRLEEEERAQSFDLITLQEAARLFSESYGRVRSHFLDHFSPEALAEIVPILDSDEATDLIQELDSHQADRVLKQLTPEEHAKLETLLNFSEDTAGGRMQREVFVVPAKTRVRRVLAELRQAGDDLEEIHDIYLVDNRGVLNGVISIFQLLRLELTTPVIEGANMSPLYATPEEDQEYVAGLFRKYRLKTLPVVDLTGRILGQITADDILDVMEEEATEDLYRLANVNEDSDLTEPLSSAVRRRATWLSANALAGVISATVVSLFESSISQLTALAVLMPIVANIGGMGGVQTATIMVRAISLGQTELESTSRIILRQSLVGFLVGIIFCVAGGFLAALFLGHPKLGIIFGGSLAAILFLSGALGSLIPIGLKRLGIDPALVSGSLLTTITDSLAFLIFLGLASIFLL